MKLLLTGRYEVGNGYNCHCCRRTEEILFNETTVEELLKYLYEASLSNDGDVVFDADELHFENIKPHHDRYYLDFLVQYIQEKADKIIKHANSICVLEKQQQNIFLEIGRSEQFLKTVNVQIATHTANLKLNKQKFEEISKELNELKNS